MAGMQEKLSLQQINELSQDDFVAALGSLFEASPWIASQTWGARPFRNVRALHAAMCETMYRAGRLRQMALIQAHPDLVGRAAQAGLLTRESADEQASAGLDRLSHEEAARFAEMNAAYRARFGFPFVICVRENKKEAILAGFEARLNNSLDREVDEALEQIARIAWLRLLDVVDDRGAPGI